MSVQRIGQCVAAAVMVWASVFFLAVGNAQTPGPADPTALTGPGAISVSDTSEPLPAEDSDPGLAEAVPSEPSAVPRPDGGSPAGRDRENGSDSAPAKEPSGVSLWMLIKAGGWIGVLIFLLSLAACSLVIELLVSIRRKTLLPPPLIEEFGPLVEKGRLQSALECCLRHPSLLASVLGAGLKNFEAGWDDVEKGASEALTRQTARLYRRNDFLAVIGNIAPMLGLLGTVLGMVAAFGELSAGDGLGRFANLAQGIYFALVTTVDGLLVAIPALAAYSYFNHRVASLSSEAAEWATELFRPLKRHFLARSSAATPPGPIPNRPTGRPHPPEPNE